MTRPLSPTSVELQLLGISDAANRIASLVDALEMATSGIIDGRQRDAMGAAVDVVMIEMDSLKDQIEAAREAAGKRDFSEELSLSDQIAALEKRLAERRFAMTTGASE